MKRASFLFLASLLLFGCSSTKMAANLAQIESRITTLCILTPLSALEIHHVGSTEIDYQGILLASGYIEEGLDLRLGGKYYFEPIEIDYFKENKVKNDLKDFVQNCIMAEDLGTVRIGEHLKEVLAQCSSDYCVATYHQGFTSSPGQSALKDLLFNVLASVLTLGYQSPLTGWFSPPTTSWSSHLCLVIIDVSQGRPIYCDNHIWLDNPKSDYRLGDQLDFVLKEYYKAREKD